MKKTKKELMAELRGLQDQMSTIIGGAQNRELNDDENKQMDSLEREFRSLNRELSLLNAEDQTRALEKPEPKKTLNETLRELSHEARDTGALTRAVTMDTNINDSGAIRTNIHDIIPTLNEGLGLPSSIHIVTGVTGNDLYPYGVNDTEMEEQGETAELTEQDLDFDKLTVTFKRAGMAVAVSNTAIDNADFDRNLS